MKPLSLERLDSAALTEQRPSTDSCYRHKRDHGMSFLKGLLGSAVVASIYIISFPVISRSTGSGLGGR